ncbi:hypothetical protein HYH03_010914 [Edaphochlamys debaryana]|uniref:Uncharacterized protein n=1 Tax=Edaphochlamys debaryana TaxID=47281 RepID=A0A835XYI5_9CHLO|nr:hypothetical protein HYH03_010914 [Edaphochlamys debaryana]|eukprot:KAG2490761.1 hypothetical protein HYH03_010914 [Edaphochlamys debaryana]
MNLNVAGSKPLQTVIDAVTRGSLEAHVVVGDGPLSVVLEHAQQGYPLQLLKLKSECKVYQCNKCGARLVASPAKEGPNTSWRLELSRSHAGGCGGNKPLAVTLAKPRPEGGPPLAAKPWSHESAYTSSRGERFTFNLQRPVRGVRLVGGDVGTPLWEESAEQGVGPLPDFLTDLTRRSAAAGLQRRLGVELGPDCLVLVGSLAAVQQRGAGVQGEAYDKLLPQLRDISGFNALFVATRPSKTPLSKPGLLSGQECNVLAAVAQVADHEKAKVIKRLHHEVYKFPGRRKSTQHSTKRGAEFDMVGNVLIECNHNSCSPGYKSMVDQRHGNEKEGVPASGLLPSAKTPLEKTVHELCSRVWEVVVEKFPFMAKYREEFMTELGRKLTLGSSAAIAVSFSENTMVELHLDTKDGPWSIIPWLHYGDGDIIGGPFCMPDLMARFIPMDLTILIIAGTLIVHGTAAPTAIIPAKGGPLPYRLGALSPRPFFARNAGHAPVAVLGQGLGFSVAE